MHADNPWKLIENAPRDGTLIVALSVTHGHCGKVFFNHEGEWEQVNFHDEPQKVGFYPTHWVALPGPSKRAV